MQDNNSSNQKNIEENQTLFGIKDGSVNDIDFSKILRSLLRRKKIIGLVGGAIFLTIGSSTIYERLFNPIYKGSFILLVSDPLDTNKSNKFSKDLEGKFENFASVNSDNDVPTLMLYLRSYLVIEELAKKYNISPRALSRRIIIKSIQNKAGETTKFDLARGVLKVELITRNRQKDLPLLRDLSETYLQVSLKRRQRRLNDGLSFLNNQQPILQEKLDSIESQIVNFREKYSLIEPKLTGISIKKQQEIIENESFQLYNERDELEKIKSRISEGSLTAVGFQEAIGQNNQGLTITGFDKTLLDQLLIAEEQLAKARSKYTPNSKFVLELEEYVQKIKPLLIQSQLEAVDTALQINKTKIESNQKLQKDLNTKFLSKPALIKTYNSLDQELKIAKNNLFGLEQARENFQLQLAQSSINWKVIDPPKMSRGPIRPSLRRGLASGLAMGALFGLIAGLIRDKLDNVFHSPRQIEDELGVPILGHIPHVSRFKNLRSEDDNKNVINVFENDLKDLSKTDKNERFFYQEAFRNLYTSIRFLRPDSQIKSLVITSSISSEGKSLINILLSKTCAELGRKVLLIDSDLRKPQIHKRLGLNNLKGLSNFLSESDNDWREYMQDIPQFDNWKVITSGISPPDPSRLLSSKKMKDAIQSIIESKEFDLVLIDTPPVLGLADAPLLTEYVDGIFLLVSLEKVNRGLPLAAIKRLTDLNANLYGVLTNSIKEMKDSNSSSYGYGYGKYGYGYGYGYGYNNYLSEYTDDNNQKNLDSQNLEKANNELDLFKKIKENILGFSRTLIKWLDE